jgi:hypothetical protein
MLSSCCFLGVHGLIRTIGHHANAAPSYASTGVQDGGSERFHGEPRAGDPAAATPPPIERNWFWLGPPARYRAANPIWSSHKA